jgi:hypothetical protein
MDDAGKRKIIPIWTEKIKILGKMAVGGNKENLTNVTNQTFSSQIIKSRCYYLPPSAHMSPFPDDS